VTKVYDMLFAADCLLDLAAAFITVTTMLRPPDSTVKRQFVLCGVMVLHLVEKLVVD